MKRLIVCCDGTWQSQDNQVPTNAFKIAQAIEQLDKRNNIPQALYYDQGIGAVPSRGGTQAFLKSIGDAIEKIGGGAFGWWIDEKIEEAYIFLCLNYETGDEIYLFGFSRGAYTVRSLVGLINCSGLLKRPDINNTAEAYSIYRIGDRQRRDESAKKFRQKNNIYESVKINFLGCWDTVGSLGIPNLTPLLLVDDYLNVRYQFHDNELSSIIENARHAIAIDERTPGFDVAIMKPGKDFQGTLKQVWFPGNHTSVGGGEKETLGLSNAALRWMADEASELGLDLDLDLAENTDIIDFKTDFQNNCISKILDVLDPCGITERDITNLNDKLPDGFKFDLDNSFHESVKKRWCADIEYHPSKLKEFIGNNPHNWCL
ncbi:MAG: DUF2235 domain-containing protein [Xenococcaceae cyanobacterium MO_188.B29]|nr:DUF2235 domain-containing protein [Xenococcaceae cyanobacterium MO_188.B29]